MRTVQILGTAPNLALAPKPRLGDEVWCANQRKSYQAKRDGIADSYTRWFNLHPLAWIRKISPREWRRLQGLDGSKPLYLQEATQEIPGSVAFPKDDVLQWCGHRFFTLSASWMMALAIREEFERIELWGFEQRQAYRYAFERPCFFYWVDVARSCGIEVVLPPEIIIGPVGDPQAYTGPLYGFETHSLDPKVTYELPGVGLPGLRRR